jgi:hydrogenase nickel incorporation protein HypA/HybF
MHEASLAKNIIEILNANSQLINGRSVKSVTVRMGELIGAYKDTLIDYFQEYSSKTPFDGAQLIVDECPIKAKCRECRIEFEIKNFEINCPSCQNQQFDLIGGNEFDIINLEVE